MPCMLQRACLCVGSLHGELCDGAMMLRYGLGMHEEADRLDGAVDTALEQGLRTPDLAGGEDTREVGTVEMTEAVVANL